MKNVRSRILSMLLVLIILVSSLVIPSHAATGQPSEYSSQYNSGQRDVVCTTLDGTSADSYYTGSYDYDILSTQSASSIESSLRTLMRNTHSYKSSYDDCHYKADRSDCENEDGRVSLIYTNYSATMGQWNGWNREHVWPKSLGGDTTSGGGADMHHIRPSDAVVNSTRNNYKYGNTNKTNPKYGSNPASGYLGGYLSGGYFEPLDNVKGDVARICLYVYVRWYSDWGATSITKVFQSVDVLLEWCELDPVDTWEMGRNEVVQNIQGNRNVFIDYPEYAWLIFGREVPEDMVTPSGKAMDGGGDPNCSHTNTEIRNKVDATCSATGYTGDIYCKDCGKKMSSGTTVNKTAHGATEIKNSKEPTCTASGYTGDTYCTVCNGKISSGTTKPATGHTTTTQGATSPTCTTFGYSGDKYCTVCQTTVSKGTELPPNGHSWSDWVEDTASGTKTSTCSACSKTKTQPIDTPECTHTNTVVKNAVAASCNAQGYTGDTYCADCDEKISTGIITEATGSHAWGDGVVTVEPAVGKQGEKTYTCTGCGTTKTEAIPALTPTPTPPVDDDPIVDEPEAVWGESYDMNEEKIVAVISKNTLYYIILDLLTKA